MHLGRIVLERLTWRYFSCSSPQYYDIYSIKSPLGPIGSRPSCPYHATKTAVLSRFRWTFQSLKYTGLSGFVDFLSVSHLINWGLAEEETTTSRMHDAILSSLGRLDSTTFYIAFLHGAFLGGISSIHHGRWEKVRQTTSMIWGCVVLNYETG